MHDTKAGSPRSGTLVRLILRYYCRVTNEQIVAVVAPMAFKRFDDMRELWRSELRRVEGVLDARRSHIEDGSR